MIKNTDGTNNSLEAPSSNLNSAKWGEALNDGFVMIPSALLRNQKKLNLNNGEMVVLLNLLMSWWKVDENPHIQSATIATRMKTSKRTAQRHIESLQEKGLIKRIWAKRSEEERAGASYDLTGVVFALQDLGRLAHPARNQAKLIKI